MATLQGRARQGPAHRRGHRQGGPAHPDDPAPAGSVRPGRRAVRERSSRTSSTAPRTASSTGEAADEAMVLLRNDGTLPLDPATTKKVAVVGPLQDTLFTDWYGATLPYEVTPLDGIKERLGARATVTGVDAPRPGRVQGHGDRQVPHRHRHRRPTTPSPRPTATPTPASQWDVTDWMADVSTLRNVGNGKLPRPATSGRSTPVRRHPTGWYVQQQFRLEKQADGSYLLRYDGYETNESWWSSGRLRHRRAPTAPSAPARKDAGRALHQGRRQQRHRRGGRGRRPAPTRRWSWSAATRSSTAGRTTTGPAPRSARASRR